MCWNNACQLITTIIKVLLKYRQEPNMACTYEWGLSVQTVRTRQWWRTGLAIVLCCVKLLGGFIFITCATFHGVLPWGSQCLYWGCRQRFRRLFGVNSFCMGPSDLTAMCVPAPSMRAAETPPDAVFHGLLGREHFKWWCQWIFRACAAPSLC